MRYPIGKKYKEQKIFTDEPSKVGFSTYPYIFQSSLNLNNLKDFIGIYIVSVKDDIIYVGETNKSLKDRIIQFIYGLNFGRGHACGNKICWLKNKEFLLNLIRSTTLINDKQNKENYLKNLQQSLWYRGLEEIKLLEKIKKTEFFKIDMLMINKDKSNKNSYSLGKRRIISILESYSILTALKNNHNLPLNYD